MVKYFFEYYDVINILHRCEISKDDYLGDPIEIQGAVFLDSSNNENILEAIKGQGLRVDLEASNDMTFEDLYTEQQRVFTVDYYRDGELLFNGWLNPDGFYQDYVNSKWTVGFDCVDGLGYLEDLAFVNNITGLPLAGRVTQMEALVTALSRVGLPRNINVKIGVYYTDLPDTVNVLENVYLIASRFVKDDDNTIMSSEQVIKDILEPYGAVLTSVNGEWVVYKPNEQLRYPNDKTFFSYDYEGTYLGTKEIGKNVLLGSDTNQGENTFDGIHANENQSFRNTASVGAFRIEYKYGLVRGFIDNVFLYHEDATTIPDWNILDNTYIQPIIPGEYGITWVSQLSYPLSPSISSEPVTIVGGLDTVFSLRYSSYDENNFFFLSFKLQMRVRRTDTLGDVYYLGQNGEWLKDAPNTYISWNLRSSLRLVITFDFTIPQQALDGDVEFIIDNPGIIDYNTIGYFNLLGFAYKPVNEDDTGNSPEGVTYTFTRADRPSAKIEETKEVSTADNATDVYLGTLYKNDKVTPTETWYRKGVVEAEEIIYIMGKETLRMYSNTARVFSGDIYGYFPAHSLIQIDGLPGYYTISQYSYDTVNNLISMEVKQMFNDESFTINVEPYENYGNVVRPTITDGTL